MGLVSAEFLGSFQAIVVPIIQRVIAKLGRDRGRDYAKGDGLRPFLQALRRRLIPLVA